MAKWQWVGWIEFLACVNSPGVYDTPAERPSIPGTDTSAGYFCSGSLHLIREVTCTLRVNTCVTRGRCSLCWKWHRKWSDLGPICTALSSFSFFFSLLSRTNGSLQIFWTSLPPQVPQALFSGPGEGTVVNAMWLTDSHFPDSGSDWSSPAPAIRLQSTLACIPFSFAPLLFPSVAHHAGSGFWALCLDCMQ